MAQTQAIRLVAIAASLLVGWTYQAAGFGTPQDVEASQPIYNFDGSILPGTNPYGTCPDPGWAPVPTCLVQILSVGSNNVAHLPNPDGSPSGGDTLLTTVLIGAGVYPCTLLSGTFSTSFDPRPANGIRIYARAFNGTNVASATYWGQSATYMVTNSPAVFDVSAAGLRATTMPMGVDITTTLDAKGVTYYSELVANTDPLNPADSFTASNLVVSNAPSVVRMSVTGKLGRAYTLQRATNDLPVATWIDIGSPVAGSDSSLILSDPSPPPTSKAFYRVKVTMP